MLFNRVEQICIIVLTITGLVAVCSLRGQSVWHVSPAGNNSNPGTAGQPLKNIAAALDSAAVGDTIKVTAGNYAENLITQTQVILLGGFSSDFTTRDLFLHASVIEPVGGTILEDAQSSTIDGFVADGNSGAGTAFLVTGGHAVLTHNIVRRISASGGTGIEVTPTGAATIKNNTLANNLLSGGGVIVYAIDINGNADSSSIVQNNITYNNNVGIHISPDRVTDGYNCSYANTFMDWDGTFGSQGSTDISADPRFIHLLNGDFRLKASSPCNDVGNPADDYSTEPAPNGGRIDMGAYGGTSRATSTSANLPAYVSTTGSDANPGTFDMPYLTIQKALDNAIGDTIKVAAGIYNEGLITSSVVVVLGGYTETFADTNRDFFSNRTILNAVSATMMYDAFGCTFDGLWLDGGTTVAERGIEGFAGTTIRHTVITKVRKSPGYAVYLNETGFVINNLIWDNIYGIYLESSATGSTVKNNIIGKGSFGIINHAAAGIARYNDLYTNSFNYSGTYTSPGTGDLGVNPLFENETNGDFRLKSGSPCIDAGDPNDDASEETAPNDTRIDMGAYGGTKNSVAPPNPAPAAPQLLSAQAGNGSVTLRWVKNSELDVMRYRIYQSGNPNASVLVDSIAATDTVRTRSGLTNGNTYYFRIRAIDSAFNASSYSNELSATPTLSGDNTSPQLSDVSYPSSVAGGADANVSVTATDNTLLQTVSLKYKQTSQTAYQTAAMTLSTGSTYSGSVPGTAATHEGLLFYVEATDTAGNLARTDTFRIAVNFSVFRSDEVDSEYPSGVPDGRWRLVSVPGIKVTYPISEAFSSIGSAGENRWLAFDETGANISSGSIETGHGFWFKEVLSGSNVMPASGSGTSADPGGFDIVLHPGWNIIGNPYAFPISFSLPQGASLYSGPYQYGGLDVEIEGWGNPLTPVPTLKPFGGYALKNNTGSQQTIRLAVNQISILKTHAAPSFSSIPVAIQIKAMADYHGMILGDLFNFAIATTGDEFYEVPEPPHVGEFVSVSFSDRRLAVAPVSFNPQGHAWTFTVESVSGIQNLRWCYEALNLPPGYRIAWYDVSNNRSIENVGAGEWLGLPASGDLKTRLRLIVGTDTFVQDELARIAASLPQAFMMYPNYPNPFNPRTTITFDVSERSRVHLAVFNALGQHVATLINGVLDPGNHRIVWDGRDHSGTSAASGVYFYCLRAVRPDGRSWSATRRMLLLK